MSEQNTTIEPASELARLSTSKYPSDLDVTCTDDRTSTINDDEWQEPIRAPHMGLLSSCNMVSSTDPVDTLILYAPLTNIPR
jgi:hypothetical protein